MYDSVLSAVLEHSREFPRRMALADTERSYTYGELTRAVSAAAASLDSLGITAGGAVIVECTQDTRFIIIDLACMLRGIVFVPLEKNAVSQRAAEIYSEASALCVISPADRSAAGRWVDISEVDFSDSAPAEELIPADNGGAAEILFTTGTTGSPKGIVMTNRANAAVAENIMRGVEMNSGTAELVPLPLSHSHGLRTCYASLLNGSASVIIDGVTNVGLFFKMIDRYGVNAIDFTPTLAKLLLKVARRGLEDISDRIEYIEIGTAALGSDVKDELKKTFPHTRLYNFYGSTEAGRCCVLDFSRFDGKGCIGKPSVNSTITIVDDNGEPIESSEGNSGLLAVSGSMVMLGYLNSPGLTRSVLRGNTVYTGDIGYIGSDGRIYLIGRKGDVINCRGIKIAPEEIEIIAAAFEGVADCACVPREDSVSGQVPVLFVKPADKDNFSSAALMEHFRNVSDNIRIPAAIELIDEIPRTENGKIIRRKLYEK